MDKFTKGAMKVGLAMCISVKMGTGKASWLPNDRKVSKIDKFTKGAMKVASTM